MAPIPAAGPAGRDDQAGSRERTLVLLRHAKSAWPDVADHDRPLAKRGQRDAPVMGRWLASTGCTPNLVVCSTARRTRETWQLAGASLDPAPPVTFEPRLYGASATVLIGLVQHVPAAVGTVLAVGHSPSVQEAALILAADPAGPDGAPDGALERLRAKFPTAAVAVLRFTGTWPGLGPGRARLTAFVTPDDLGAGHALTRP